MNFHHCNYGTTYQLTENPYHKTELARMVKVMHLQQRQAVSLRDAVCGDFGVAAGLAARHNIWLPLRISF